MTSTPPPSIAAATPEFVEPLRWGWLRQQRDFWALFVVFVAPMWLLHRYRLYAHPDERVQFWVIYGLFAWWTTWLLFLAGKALWLAFRGWRAGRWPPPGASVYGRHRVSYGWRARLLWALPMTVAGAIPLWLVFALWTGAQIPALLGWTDLALRAPVDCLPVERLP